MKHLYYARHGESYINIEDIFATKPGAPNDKGLTERGKSQALASVKHAKDKNLSFDLIISSPLIRAQETAQIIASQVSYPLGAIETSDLFVELQFGALEGTPWNTYWNAGKSYADLGAIPGAETIELLQQRAQKALEYARSLPQDTILIVSHSAFGRAFKRAVAGLPASDEFTNGVSLPHGEIIQLI